MTNHIQQKYHKHIYTIKYDIVKRWYNNIYKDLGEKFGVSIEAYRQFPDYFNWKWLIRYKPDLTYLDIACGQGYMLYLAKQYGIKKLYGMDISRESIRLCKKLVPEAKYKIDRAEELKYYRNNFFNYITCIGSLEHFIDKKKALQRMYDVGKVGCKYCILIPNSKSWWHNTTKQREINEHFYSLNEWSEMFEQIGFKIIKVYRDKWHIIKPQSFIKKILNWITPLKYFNSFVFILEKPNYMIQPLPLKYKRIEHVYH